VKRRLWLYILVMIATLNSCQTVEFLLHEACTFTWYEQIYLMIVPEYADKGLSGECYELEATRI